jgi:TctA family transporter
VRHSQTIDSSTGQDRLTFGVPQLLDGIDIVIVAVGVFSVGETLWTALHLRRKASRDHPRRAALDEPVGLGSLLEALAAWRRHRVPVRRHAGRRR